MWPIDGVDASIQPGYDQTILLVVTAVDGDRVSLELDGTFDCHTEGFTRTVQRPVTLRAVARFTHLSPGQRDPNL
jgi:hypothetical protein